MKKKIRLIFLPYVLLVVSFTIAYSFLNWLLFIRTQNFSIREDIPNMWLPLTLPWVLVYIWLRPRIKLLNLVRSSGNLPALFFIIAGFGIAVPALIAQAYLVTATGKLTMMERVEGLAALPRTKYYRFEQHFTDRSHAGAHTRVYISGRNNTEYNMQIYLAMPLVSDITDTTAAPCSHWIGYSYEKRISNRKSREEKKQAFKDFWQESMNDFETRDYDRFIYLDRVGNTTDRQRYDAALRRSPRFGYGNNILLLGINEPFEDRNGNKLAWIFGAFGIGAALWLLMLSLVKFDGSALRRFEKGHSDGGGGVDSGGVGVEDPGMHPGNESHRAMGVHEAKGAHPGEGNGEDAHGVKGSHPGKKPMRGGSDLDAVLLFFVPKKKFLVTPLLIDLNFLIFILLVCAGAGFVEMDTRTLLAWGGNYRPYTTDGQWWRLLTSMFLHGGLIHLVANMAGLFFVGIFLEPVIGAKRYAIGYLVTGLAGSVTSLYLHDAVVSIGASGAIFGLFGIFLALLLGKVLPAAFSKSMLVPVLIFVGYNLVAGMAGGVDNAAHVGGLVSGMILGFLLAPGVRRELEEKGSFVPSIGTASKKISGLTDDGEME